MVLQDEHKSTHAVVECKRFREAEWVFLHTDGRAPPARTAKGWVSHYEQGRFARFDWAELEPYPQSVEAGFCAIRGQSANDKSNLLERIGSELIVATEALAAEERDLRPSRYGSMRFYFPVIVTTADLKVGTFDPLQVSLTDGTVPSAEFVSVPFLRFRKQLSTRQIRPTPEDYDGPGSLSYMKEHTVFVVRADALPRFLGDLCVPPGVVRHLQAQVADR